MKMPPFIAAEIERHPGVTARLEQGRKHAKVIMEFNGRSRFVTISVSPSCRRAEMNGARDVRRTLREMGA